MKHTPASELPLQVLANHQPITDQRVRLTDLADDRIRNFLFLGELAAPYLRIKKQSLAEFEPASDREKELVARIIVMRWRRHRLLKKQDILDRQAQKLLRRNQTPFSIQKLLRVLSFTSFKELRDQIMDVMMQIRLLDRSCSNYALMIKALKKTNIAGQADGDPGGWLSVGVKSLL